jgi:Holliday junction DNA helicase RuvA
MIAYIQGKLIPVAPTQIIIEAAGGIGYEIQISLYTYTQIKTLTHCKLFSYLHITADAHTLYGFADTTERKWFLHLLQVNGIGPRVAITILSSLTSTELQQAIIGKHITTLQTIKGIGPKAAQRIILELSNKVATTPLPEQESISALELQEKLQQEALAALLKLGIPKAQAEKAIIQVIRTHPEELSLENLIKLALKT